MQVVKIETIDRQNGSSEPASTLTIPANKPASQKCIFLEEIIETIYNNSERSRKFPDALRELPSTRNVVPNSTLSGVQQLYFALDRDGYPLPSVVCDIVEWGVDLAGQGVVLVLAPLWSTALQLRDAIAQVIPFATLWMCECVFFSVLWRTLQLIFFWFIFFGETNLNCVSTEDASCRDNHGSFMLYSPSLPRGNNNRSWGEGGNFKVWLTDCIEIANVFYRHASLNQYQQ